ncbi:unnamed protein product [Linum trigynum]|uniref:Uncharacterized protein n=1 Tax=Linum trigynum TaxID=586398 RepID=A0AAV2E8I3_9ROSI
MFAMNSTTWKKLMSGGNIMMMLPKIFLRLWKEEEVAKKPLDHGGGGLPHIETLHSSDPLSLQNNYGTMGEADNLPAELMPLENSPLEVVAIIVVSKNMGAPPSIHAHNAHTHNLPLLF